MVFPIVGANSESAVYEISNSMRFNRGSASYLAKTFSGTPTSTKICTISFWTKLADPKDTNAKNIFSAIKSGSNEDCIKFMGINNGILNNLEFVFNNTNAGSMMLTSGSDFVKFRDPSAWYHIVVAIDSSQGTASNRLKVYVNGTQFDTERRIEGGSPTDDVPLSQNYELGFLTASLHAVGYNVESDGNEPYDGYISEFYFIDGQQLAPTSFGETDDNGVWVPIDAKNDLTFGNYGFFLEFKQTGSSANSSGMGADTSGNDNHFGPSGMGTDHITTDTPTNNFCTLNPLTAGSSDPEIREGNLQQYEHGSTNSAGAAATMMPIKGKWYAELFLNAPSGNDYPFFGITDTYQLNRQGAQGTKMAAGFEISGNSNNQGTNNLGTITNTNTGWPSFSDNDIIMYALDCDNRKLWLGRNGTWINSGDPAGNSNQQLSWTLDANVCPFLLGYDNSQSGGGGDESMWNYGNPPFSISSSNSDANGYGNFEYEVPSGYYALCTKNLAEFG